MDMIKKLTGKKPNEYEAAAKYLLDNSDVTLFSKLVEQDDFLFDFIKENVSKRLLKACNKDNYKNLLNFFEYYSDSYADMFAEALHTFGDEEVFDKINSLYLNGTDSQKAYATKFYLFAGKDIAKDFAETARRYANSEYEPLALNSVELLSFLEDDISKNNALRNLDSEDEFVQYDAVKFLTAFQAKDAVDKIIEVMKKSTLSENIASEIPYLIPLDELLDKNYDNGILVLCHIINAIPEIISLSAIKDYALADIFDRIINKAPDSQSALLLRIAKDKFEELTSNEEYLFDCDKNTKDLIKEIDEKLKQINPQKLKSYFYDELYEDSDLVFFAIDYVDEKEELESLLDSKNQTLLLKVLTLLKDKNLLNENHKNEALKTITSDDIKQIVEML